jgi:hypothetical protein
VTSWGVRILGQIGEDRGTNTLTLRSQMANKILKYVICLKSFHNKPFSKNAGGLLYLEKKNKKPFLLS